MWKWWPLVLDNQNPRLNGIVGLYNAAVINAAIWTLIIWACLALFGD